MSGVIHLPICLCVFAYCNVLKYESFIVFFEHLWFVSAPLIRSRPWRYINLFTYLLTYSVPQGS